MNLYFQLKSGEGASSIALQTIDQDDLDDLRSWKNKNRRLLLHAGEIGGPALKAWFEEYLGQESEFIFKVMSPERLVGFMGFRVDGETAGINLLAAPARPKDRAAYDRAFRLLTTYIHAHHTQMIRCPMVGLREREWIRATGYRVFSQTKDSAALELDPARFAPIPFEKNIPGVDGSRPPGLGYYPIPVDLKTLLPDQMNFRHLDDGIEAVVIASNGVLRIIRDFCPHMGAPMSQGQYSPGDCTLRCPWHGYAFNGVNGEFLKNPNDKAFSPLKNLYASYKPSQPRYRLGLLGHRVVDGKAWVERGSAA